MVFQQFNLFSHPTVLQNSTLAPKLVLKEPPSIAEQSEPTSALDAEMVNEVSKSSKKWRAEG